MGTGQSRIARIATAVALTSALAAGLSGCIIPAPNGGATTQTDDGGSDMSLDAVYAAVDASDPRIARTSSVVASTSGAAEVLSVVVRLTGTEPVSTQTVANILVAAVESSPHPVDQLDLIARVEGDDATILDLSAAAAGLPESVSYDWRDSTLKVTSPDPDVIAAAQ